jgi:transcriptional regulator with XRE-family HTH domain
MKNSELRAARVRRDLNQFDAARKARIAFNRYCRIELGQAEPTPAEQKRIARALKANAAELFGEAAPA